MDVTHIAQLLTLAHKATLHLAGTPAVVMAMTTAQRPVNSKHNDRSPAKHRDRVMSEQSVQPRHLPAQLQEHLAGLQARAEAAEAALDSLVTGVFTLDAKGQVVRANRTGEAILNARDGLSLRNDRLHCARPRETARLDAAIAQAISAIVGHGTGGGSVLSVFRPSLLRTFGVAVVPVRVHDGSQGPLPGTDEADGAAVLVIVSDPEHTPQIPEEHLSRLFGLTPAEARLAAALTARATVEEYAEQAGISRGTARWTLKCVLDKTGCHRQSELMLLLATSVAALLGA